MIVPNQAPDLDFTHQHMNVRIQVEVAKKYVQDLRDHAVALEAREENVPATLNKFISDAVDRHQVEFVRFKHKIAYASTEAVTADKEKHARREWTVRRELHVLHGRAPLDVLYLHKEAHEYNSAPPQEPELTEQLAQVKQTYTPAAAYLTGAWAQAICRAAEIEEYRIRHST